MRTLALAFVLEGAFFKQAEREQRAWKALRGADCRINAERRGGEERRRKELVRREGTEQQRIREIPLIGERTRTRK